MKLVRAFAIIVASGFMGVLQPAAAQTPAAKVSLQAEILKDWTTLKATMTKLASEMPADKFTFKASAGQQTFGERVVHVASANVYFMGLLGGSAPKPAIDNKATTKDAAIKALNDSFDYGEAVLKQQTDETLQKGVAEPPKFMGPSSGARVVSFVSGHTWDIYGQLAVYLRLNGLVPPASQNSKM